MGHGQSREEWFRLHEAPEGAAEAAVAHRARQQQARGQQSVLPPVNASSSRRSSGQPVTGVRSIGRRSNSRPKTPPPRNNSSGGRSKSRSKTPTPSNKSNRQPSADPDNEQPERLPTASPGEGEATTPNYLQDYSTPPSPEGPDDPNDPCLEIRKDRRRLRAALENWRVEYVRVGVNEDLAKAEQDRLRMANDHLEDRVQDLRDQNNSLQESVQNLENEVEDLRVGREALTRANHALEAENLDHRSELHEFREGREAGGDPENPNHGLQLVNRDLAARRRPARQGQALEEDSPSPSPRRPRGGRTVQAPVTPPRRMNTRSQVAGGDNPRTPPPALFSPQRGRAVPRPAPAAKPAGVSKATGKKKGRK
jgi:FtsZ-binding cell division protein ZapB